MRWFRRRRRYNYEIDPDEIFLDSTNLSSFDSAQFEGRLEKPISQRTFAGLFIALGILSLILILRAADLQIIKGPVFAEESANNSLSSEILFAQRGVITDRYGKIITENIKRSDGSVRRYYKLPEMGSIIGYVSSPKKDSSGRYYDTQEVGVAGLEKQYNTLLTGKNGTVLKETDAFGRVRSQGVIIPAKKGGTLKLSIDADLEELFAKSIANVVERKHFVAGAGVIMDVNTGEVRAIVSYPSYDPNVMVNGGPSSVIVGYSTDKRHPFLDHAAQGVYVPGSIVKPFVSAGALTDGVITQNTVIDDKGRISIPDPYHAGKEFVYTGWKALGPVNVRKAIAWSSDIFFYTVGGGFGKQKGLGIDRLDYWYKQFGLGSLTGIDLPREVKGLVPGPSWKRAAYKRPWYLGDTYFTAIGQYAMQVTPLQMARATAAVANGGKLLTPRMRFSQGVEYTRVPVTSSSLEIVKEGMRMGVTTALAGAINLPYVDVAAKTGTAQVGINNQYDNAWVEGFFPYEKPVYSFAVVLERGPSGAGEQAVNVMRELFVSLKKTGNGTYVNVKPITTQKTTNVKASDVSQ